MSALPKLQETISSEDYLFQERQNSQKHEFVEGIIYAMAGASEEHVLITGNVFGEIYSIFKQRSCKVYNNDMRVKVNKNDYVYPDIVAVCGESKFEDNVFDTLINPTVIIEVLSESTENYDCGKKAALYRHLETVQECLLIAQDRCYIEHYQRHNESQWLLTIISNMNEVLTLKSINVQITVQDIYHRTKITH
jgi:Uma2 family endonuclease